MKIFLNSAIGMLCFSSLSASVKMSQELNEIFMPTAQILSQKEIAKGEKIYAFKTNVIFNGNRVSHYAEYLGGTIETVLIESSNSDEYNNVGTQFVEFYKERSYSDSIIRKWTLTSIDGNKYMVHEHSKFYVYTNADKQFVIKK